MSSIVLAAAVAVLVPTLARAGVIVEEAQRGFAADQAGLKTGDVLVAWRRAASPPANPEAAHGAIESPFDLQEVEREQAPRGPLMLIGTREGVPLEVSLPPGSWRLKCRPPMDSGDLEGYEEGGRRVLAEDHDKALALWRDVALARRSAGDEPTATWLFAKAARVAAQKRRWETADACLNEIPSGTERPVDRLVQVHALVGVAEALEVQNEFDRANRRYEEALVARRSLSSPSLMEAWILNRRALIAGARGESRSEEDIRHALAMTEALAPDSLDVANVLNTLGITATYSGRLEDAADHHRRALAIRQRLAPEGLDAAGSHNNLGLIAERQGDFVVAEEHYRRSLEIKEKLALENDLSTANTLNNLGNVAWKRGDFEAAEEHYQRALAISQRAAPESLGLANALANLGALMDDRGDHAAAEEHLRQALRIKERVAPESGNVARSLNNVALHALEEGDLAEAERLLTRALAIDEKVAPDSLDVAASLTNLAEVESKRGQTARALEHLARAAAIVGQRGPNSTRAAATAYAQGEMALARGDLDGAEAHYRRALDVRRERAPGTSGEAEACERLAAIERRRGRLEPALVLYRQALEAIETQRRRLGGTNQGRLRFSAQYAPFYRDTIDVLMGLGRGEEAFHVLERYRARGFLAMLAERDLVFSTDISAELDRERRLANAEYDRALAGLGDAKDDTLTARRGELDRARRRQADVEVRIRAASPRLAALQYPEPLDLPAARRALDPGTLVLSYSVGPDKSYLFAVGPGPDDFSATAIDATTETLRAEVARFREELDGRRPRRGRLQRAAQRLSRVLLSPVAGPIRRAERILIVPDGPLHLIPFAALADPSPSGPFRYVVAVKPLSLAASVTVFAQLVRERRLRASPCIVAFGAPDYSAASAPASSIPQLRSAQTRGLDLRALPGARDEVQALQRLYPDSSQTYLGAAATEETAKAASRGASVVHFACHGLASEDTPLESALALSFPHGWQPGRDNGLLQAWEVFEQLRIDADLVTLSACRTAVGKEMSGEGMLGLTRAFQYAGARSVLASLWAVDDGRTADLMKSFYRHLRSGESKDMALRAAQLHMIRSPASHPYHWAGFQLVGDWR
jgi:CHAT domain-containing protein/Tfp pilus assembly protein PilF